MSRVLTGATGRIGGEVVARLLAVGAEVRAITRDPAAARLPAGVEVAAGDLTLPESLEAGLDDVDAVFLVWTRAARLRNGRGRADHGHPRADISPMGHRARR